jgi:hypothetical protein
LSLLVSGHPGIKCVPRFQFGTEQKLKREAAPLVG